MLTVRLSGTLVKKGLDIERNELITFLKQVSRNIVDTGHGIKRIKKRMSI